MSAASSFILLRCHCGIAGLLALPKQTQWATHDAWAQRTIAWRALEPPSGHRAESGGDCGFRLPGAASHPPATSAAPGSCDRKRMEAGCAVQGDWEMSYCFSSSGPIHRGEVRHRGRGSRGSHASGVRWSVWFWVGGGGGWWGYVDVEPR
ncbi:LAMI_0A07646g1_1 [Lachancea mirantina]|uniref:LAMI_0A07646g1_1 n=1 Tax=Lachancea mirantina TaxID=1230905 RepID=A0A1G4IRH0_9SACH|nr:LAMI_0A07646g1_1 [Lachancea mirantina]